ncbi:quinone oxidoreductase [Methylobacterium oxalidis]|uniref:Quinone oxidoreductase n=2 Tax=Methylobacterium oxalidis TaxID=944322 RepID=A0A512JB33_9HYPH|nr:quinone oxidoreductase [Methylobacterium oxalidis]GJE34886.1 2-haloacrylate reductase [Methylobacterium oxalidis]GLS66031.1 quinone oxidoreductase [Methylobacterium oxalidis]
MAPEISDSDSGQATMMAWRVHAFGPPTVMTFESVPRPDPGEGEVLVRVHAAGVGPWDGWVRAGRSVLPQPLPLTPGSDLSGTVEAVGPGVTGFAAGDEVFGVTNPRFVGAYAEYAVASAAMLAGKPRSLTHVQAASVPVIAVTAWQGLFEQAQLQSGQTVLIHGAAGNVGAYAVQLARRAGLHTIVTAGGDDLAYVRSLGAEQVVDYRAQRFEDEVRDVDAVLDLVGGETQNRSFKVLRRGGRLVSAVSQPDQARAEQHGVRAEFFLVRVTTEHLSLLAGLLDDGELRTRVGAALPLARAREAHLMLEGEQAAPKGKIVLQVLPD